MRLILFPLLFVVATVALINDERFTATSLHLSLLCERFRDRAQWILAQLDFVNHFGQCPRYRHGHRVTLTFGLEPGSNVRSASSHLISLDKTRPCLVPKFAPDRDDETSISDRRIVEGLQRKFDEAHATLDDVEIVISDEPTRVRVRYLHALTPSMPVGRASSRESPSNGKLETVPCGYMGL